MTRYLTPQKINLLVLISLYCDSTVPSSASLPLLSFISSQILSPVTSGFQSHSSSGSASIETTIQDFQDVTAGLASYIPGRTLSDLFAKKLWSINSLDALHTFFENLHNLLASPKGEALEGTALEQKDRIALSGTSLLGAFVRRSQLEFTRLQLDDTIRLWADFLTYKKSTEPAWRRRNQSAGPVSFDVNVQELGLYEGSPLMDVAYGCLTENRQPGPNFSAHDMEELLKFQVESLQSQSDRTPVQSYC